MNESLFSRSSVRWLENPLVPLTREWEQGTFTADPETAAERESVAIKSAPIIIIIFLV